MKSAVYDAVRPSNLKVVCLAITLILAGATLWGVGKAQGMREMEISGHVITGGTLSLIGVGLFIRCVVNINRVIKHGTLFKKEELNQ